MMLKQGANNIDTRVKMFTGKNPEKNSIQLNSVLWNMKEPRQLFFEVDDHYSSLLSFLTYLLKTYNYTK